MGERSKISWTDATWNPVAGCTKVSPGCDSPCCITPHTIPGDVVTADEEPWPPEGIKSLKLCPTPTAAYNKWIVFSGFTEGIFTTPFHTVSMKDGMVISVFGQLKILWAIILFHTIDMMHLFPLTQRTSKAFCHHKTMFIDIASYISHRMPWASQQHVTIGGNCPASLPVRGASSGRE